MSILELFIASIGLAMDAFAVSICKGLAEKEWHMKKSWIIALYFGAFQGIMPIIGYYLGTLCQNFITSVDHWLACTLLSIIGIDMIYEAQAKESHKKDDKVDIKTMLPLAIATSIDALTVGISFAFLQVNIIPSAFLILMVTLGLSKVGYWLGYQYGSKYEQKSQLAGGIILILIGLKILLEDLFIL